MAKKQFKAESKRLLDLMVNSIYTHKEIFLRELISNASDAEDKLAYKALTDDQVPVDRSELKITIVPDKEMRTLTVSDNGVGMSKEDLESNLGTIAKSGSFQFKQDLAKEDKPEEYNNFYKEKFMDWQDPLAVIHTSAEGAVTYKALLYIPEKAPYDFYTREYQKGLQLYSSGVLIMDKCADLLPDHFRFVKGVVDSADFSLNISREVLQHTRQLSVIAKALEKKIKAELLKMQKEEPEKYEKFWAAFGNQIKYGVVAEYGAHKEMLQDLLLFWSSKEGKNTTLAAYKDRMPEDQPYYYYACGESVDKIAKLPQVERILDKGYEILYCTEDVDDFVMQALGEIDGKKFKSATAEDALPQTEEEKKESEEKAEAGKPVLEAVKEALGDKVKEVRISKILKTGAVCLSADGPVSLEMERYMRKLEGGEHMKAERVLELNADSAPYAALKKAVDEGDKETVEKYSKLLYGQALLLAELPLEDPAEYAQLVCSLMV